MKFSCDKCGDRLKWDEESWEFLDSDDRGAGVDSKGYPVLCGICSDEGYTVKEDDDRVKIFCGCGRPVCDPDPEGDDYDRAFCAECI